MTDPANIPDSDPHATIKRLAACELTEDQIRVLRGEWATPEDLWRVISCEFGPRLDVCANRENSKCLYFCDLAMDALAVDWGWLARTTTSEVHTQRPFLDHDHRVAWCNPPHEDFYPWAAKCREQCALGHVDVALMLCLPSFSADWWTEHVVRGADEIRLLQGRVQHIPPPLLVQAGLVDASTAKNDRERVLVIFRRTRTTVPGAPRIWSWDWRRALDFPMTKNEAEDE